MAILILANNISGSGKGIQLLFRIEQFLSEKKVQFTSFINEWPSDFNSYSYVWLIGGDGTLNYFLNKYNSIDIPIAIFKGGTGNDFAWKLYGDIDLTNQIDLILKSTAKPVDIGIFNNHFFINGVGIGFDGEILKQMKKIRWLGGHFGYLFVVIKKIFSYTEKFFKITFSNTIISEKLLLLSVFNSSRTGGGFFIAPTAEINDGFLNLILCKPLSIKKRLFNLPKIEKGKHLQLPFINHQLIKKIYIECDEETAAQIDGELFFSKTFEISILEKKLHFLY